MTAKIPSIGPITSLAFVLAIEDPNRFKDPRYIGTYLGMVPRRDQSGRTDKQRSISKAGNKYLLQLLVQCAQYLIGHFGPDVKVMAHPLARANVNRGVRVEIRWKQWKQGGW